MITLFKEFSCGCVLSAVLIDGSPILSHPAVVCCDTYAYETHCAASRLEFEEHPLGFLRAYCGWQFGEDSDDPIYVDFSHDDSVAEEP
jgi:hypothetical protein